jgi:hypothetical protein
VKKQEEMFVMIANYLTLIQFVEIHIEFHNNSHLDNIVAAAKAMEAAEAVENIEAVVEAKGHIEAAEEHIEAAEEHIEAAEEHIGAADEHIEAAEEHIEADVGHIEDNDIADIENKNVGYVEEYHHS